MLSSTHGSHIDEPLRFSDVYVTSCPEMLDQSELGLDVAHNDLDKEREHFDDYDKESDANIETDL